MIPKIIHYCWFGKKEKPELAKKCIESWKKYCPEYEIVEWNEDNFDIKMNSYVKFCYENKKYAFLSDYARLYIIYHNGGIYLDTDVELVKTLDELLEFSAFYGFESEKFINTGQGFGAIKQHNSVAAMLEIYENIEMNDDGSFPIVNCPHLNTDALVKFGIQLDGKKQLLNDMIILPVEYMNPYNDLTGELTKTSRTISIHWYSKTWLDKKTVLRSKITKPIHRIFGEDCFQRIRNIWR